MIESAKEGRGAVEEGRRRVVADDALRGDPGKAKEKLGWEVKVGIKELVRLMIYNDYSTESI